MMQLIIHVVEPGDSVYAIARKYGVSPARIIEDNMLKRPNELVIGQTLVILFPSIVHTVREGDTIDSIAERYGITVNEIYRNNPILGGNPTIYPGQTIVIEYTQPKRGNLVVNGFAYPSIETETLERTLPSLTYFSPFSYTFSPDGTLQPFEDTEVINKAKEYGVHPLMVLTNLNPSVYRFDSSLASSVLNDEDAQNMLARNVLDTLLAEGYSGLLIDFEYVYPEDREAFVSFVGRMSELVREEGLRSAIALSPKKSGTQMGLLYEAHDYPAIGQLVDDVILMTYEWGYTYGPPMAVSPIDDVKEVLSYATSVIPPEKIMMGLPNYAYDWALPYVPNQTVAKSISNTDAVNLALDTKSEIKFDPEAQTPFFFYTDKKGTRHIVWFDDARSIEAKLGLVDEYGLNGVSYWNLMSYFPQNWLVLNSLYNVENF